MKDVQGTLRRIDEQITQHNQNIARSRVEIARLQEARLVFAGLAEEDIIAAHAGKEERQGMINGAHARPVLIVRKVGSDEVMKQQAEGLNKAGNRRGMNVTKGKGTRPRRPRNPNHHVGPREGSAIEQMRKRIFTVLKDAEEPMTGSEIGNYLGLPADDKVRKPMQNALYYMRVKGQLHRDPEHRYSMPSPAPGATP
jgi:hypothetical protein